MPKNQKQKGSAVCMGLFGAKKLQEIPYDLVSYITIETEAIKDHNDKMMNSSYCLGKLKNVEWYIQLLKAGSEKYTVPHDLSYLEGIRAQLQECHRRIMSIKITNPSDRPVISIKYPKGYDG